MNDDILQKQLSGIMNPHVTPAGIIVPGRDYDGLVKAEARNIAKDDGGNQSRLFSNYMFQNMVAHGAREKPVNSVSFSMLRASAKESFVDRILIRIRKDQMKSLWQRSIDAKQKQPGFKVVHDLYDDPDFKVTDEIKKRCIEMEELIANPTPVEYTDVYPHGVRTHNGIKDLVSRLIQAELIIDRKVIRRYHRQDGKGYAAFHWLPGDTIKNVDESVREWAKKNELNGAVSQDTTARMSYASGFDIAKSAYVQMVDGMVIEAYTEDEISVHISNPSDELNKWGYGECLPWDTVIETDQGKLRIGEIVKNRMAVKVKSYNQETCKIEWQPVVNWFKRKNDEPLVRVKWGTGKRGSVVRCTPNHPILTPSGYVESSKLKVGDEVMAAGPVLTKEQDQVLLGTLLGDAHFKVSKTSGGYPSIAFCHSKKQEDYFDWKVNAINTLGRWVIERESVSRTGNRHKKKIFQSNKHVMLSRIADIIDHRDGKKHINRTWLDAIGAIGLAVWAMDDGSMQLHKTKMSNGKLWDGPGRFIFCTDRYSREECEIIKEWLSFTWDIQSSILCPPSTGKCRVRLTVDGTRKFREIVYPYLVVDGTTKIWKAPSIATGNPCGASPVRIIEIDSIAKKSSVYDIEVNQNHNFLVNGVIVHNSRLEISLDLTTTLLYAWTYNKELFKTNYPENILTVAGNFDKQGLDSFKQHILGEAGGPKNNWRLPVISTGPDGDKDNFKVESHKLRDSPKDMLFDELFRFMIMFKCAAYGAHPTVLNFSADQGSGSHMSTHDPAGEIAESKEHGLKPSLLDLCEWWTQDLIKPRYDDLKLVLTGFDNEDEKEVLELRDKRAKGWLSKNEARMEEGMKAIGDMNDPKNPWNFPADAPMSTYLSTMDMLGGDEGEGGEGGEGAEGVDNGEGADNGEGGMFDSFDDNGNENENGGLFEGGAKGKPTESPDDKIEKSQRETKFLRIKLEDE